MQRAAVPDPARVADHLVAVDLVHEDHRHAVPAECPQEHGLSGALHQRAQRGPRDLGQPARGRPAQAELERPAAETILAARSLLEVLARGQGAEQRKQAALGGQELRAQLAQGQAVAGGHHELEDVHHPAGGAVAPRRAVGSARLRERGGTHRRAAGTSNLKKRAALSPSTLARALSLRPPMVRSIASAECGHVPSWCG